MISTRTITVALMFAGFTWSSNVHAQNALGGGNALDSNFGVGTGGVNAPGAVPNFRDRNLIVTGDVIGGRGFRGSVGYTAPADFRGALGSNDTFDFRAQSAISAPPLFQLGSTYERLRFGQDIGLIEYRRAQSGAPESLMAQNPVGFADSRTRSAVDRRLLLSSSALTQQQVVEPRIVGTTQLQDGSTILLNSSVLRGISAEHPGQSVALAGLNTMDMLRIRQDATASGNIAMIGQDFQTKFNELNFRDQPQDDGTAAPDPRLGSPRDTRLTTPGVRPLGSPSATGTPSTLAPTPLQPQYQDILKRVAERYARVQNADITTSPELLAKLDEGYQGLRRELAGGAPNVDPFGRPLAAPSSPDDLQTDPDASSTSPTSVEAPMMGTPSALKARPDELALPGVQQTTQAPGAQAAPTANPYATMGAALRHGERVQQLSGPAKDRFNELIASAEQKLREGDYFLAERRFERALRLSPGQPLAMAGMAHAQLGAGLYLSASLTLRSLMTAQPEMIDVRYDRTLLPSDDRLAAATAGITARMDQAGEREQLDVAGYGFLLAYIGHQTQDRDLVERGLNAMETADPANRMLPLLREIWLKEDAAPAPVESQP